MSGDDERLKEIPGKCPTPAELGASGWNILHSSAAVYPYKPSAVQQKAMKDFIESWAHVYACSWCAYHMRDYVQKNPPDVRDKLTISRYVCELHNEVSERIGKDLFDCSADVVLRRWHPGYPAKMEDKPTIEEQLAMSAKQKAEAAAAKQRQQEAEERRFSDFGLKTREEAPRDPAGWRDPATAGDGKTGGNHNNTGTTNNKRWWFFGSSAFSGAATPAPAEVVPPADRPASTNTHPTSAAAPAAPAKSGNAAAGWNSTHAMNAAAAAPSTLSQTPTRRTKAADNETDVDAVLERLKRCQVYCPEDEELQKH